MQRRLGVIATVVALLAAGCWKPELTVTYPHTVQSDIVYGQGEVDDGGTFEDLLLDLYVPTVPGQTIFPLAVVIHGGSFTSNNKTQPRVVKWAEELAGRGYIVASIDYRLAGDKPVPSARVQPLFDAVGGAAASNQTTAAIAAIDDLIMAIEFLQARPDVSEHNTALVGNSAGSIAALYVGYTLDDYGIARPRVHAVIDNWGGFEWANTPPDAATFIDRIGEDGYYEPALFIAHGTADTVVPYWHTEEIVDQADIVGLRYVLFENVGVGHGFDLFTTEFSPGVSVFQAQVNWLDSVLIGVEDTSTTTTPPTVP
ncbi:MAG: alpha/beta hydrolase [Acidimicrobiales bacterium]|nr:alpha/beta hydrolase [Acidimicrobiales bacterium]